MATEVEKRQVFDMPQPRLEVTAARAVRGAVEQGQSAVAERISQRIVAVYDAIVLRGIAFHERQPALGLCPISVRISFLLDISFAAVVFAWPRRGAGRLPASPVPGRPT